ncbi:putative peroxiredoxin prdx-3 [Toxocara canis]|uniref:thioredoxin-dependent peroxiredoxin n=1 Tax=Toxocara canis TaxID=6265 RepID=A0A0B2V2L3_TOXCA|nr:putative peroxiredoxin prdx-3 [Toxocara canis]
MLRSVLIRSLTAASALAKRQSCAAFSTSHLLLGIRPLGPTCHVPDFQGTAVVDGDFKTISAKDYKGKWLIVFFYPLDFTFVCPTEIIAFNDRAPEFKKLGAELVACSCDSHFSHLAWIQTARKDGGLGDMQIPLLSDFSKKIADSFGVLDHEAGVSYRGLFLIDPSGVVRHTTVNDLPVGRSVDEALRVLKAFQFVEKHGEVCPADWHDEQPTIKPDVKGSKEYFNKVNK